MLKSWRLGTVFGFPIELNVSFLILLGLVLFGFGGLQGLQFVFIAFASVVLHELGHAFVARMLGVHVAGIELGFFGGAAKMVNIPRTPRHELAIAAAGPAVSLMLGGLFFGLGVALHVELFARIGWLNFVLAAFNLIPALPMDGGRILRALLVPRFGHVGATDIAVSLARVAAIGFVVLGLAWPDQMIWLLILAPFLWLMSSHERMLAQMSDAAWDSGYHSGAEVLGRRAWNDRDSTPRWGSPFDPRTHRTRHGGEMRNYTIVHRNGRIEIIALD